MMNTTCINRFGFSVLASALGSSDVPAMLSELDEGAGAGAGAGDWRVSTADVAGSICGARQLRQGTGE